MSHAWNHYHGPFDQSNFDDYFDEIDLNLVVVTRRFKCEKAESLKERESSTRCMKHHKGHQGRAERFAGQGDPYKH